MRLCAAKKEPFCITAAHKENGTNYVFSLEGKTIDRRLAERIWHGNDYLVGVHSDYSGKRGTGGSGYAVDHFEFLDGWETFKAWFDGQMKRYKNYEAEEFGQLSLF